MGRTVLECFDLDLFRDLDLLTHRSDFLINWKSGLGSFHRSTQVLVETMQLFTLKRLLLWPVGTQVERAKKKVKSCAVRPSSNLYLMSLLSGLYHFHGSVYPFVYLIKSLPWGLHGLPCSLVKSFRGEIKRTWDIAGYCMLHQAIERELLRFVKILLVYKWNWISCSPPHL